MLCSRLLKLLDLENTIAALIRMENDDTTRSPSMESWEDVSLNTPIDDGTLSGRHKDRDLRATIHVERGLHLGRANKEVTKFQLPSKVSKSPFPQSFRDYNSKDSSLGLRFQCYFVLRFCGGSLLINQIAHRVRTPRHAA